MLTIAVIGAGAISTAHIEGYLRFQDRCRIVAICDIYSEKAEARVKQFGLRAKVVQDYRELLHEGIDLVSICTPPYEHAQIAIDFLQAGSHVLIEKPMASSLKECDEINEVAERSGRLVSVIAQNRFTNPMMKLKAVLDSGLTGKIGHAQVDSHWWRGHCYYDLWWRGTWEKEGGGPTLNHAVHHIDALLWMQGRPDVVQAFMSNVVHDNAEIEDLSIAILRYPSGALGQVTSSVVHHGEEQQLIFQGERARISAPWKLKASKSRANGFPQDDEQLETEIQQYYDSLPDLAYEGHTAQIENVMTAIVSGSPVLIDGRSGRNALELIMAIYKSASIGETVQLPLLPDDPFYTRDGVLKHATYFYKKKSHVENFTDMAIRLGTDLEKRD